MHWWDLQWEEWDVVSVSSTKMALKVSLINVVERVKAAGNHSGGDVWEALIQIPQVSFDGGLRG